MSANLATIDKTAMLGARPASRPNLANSHMAINKPVVKITKEANIRIGEE